VRKGHVRGQVGIDPGGLGLYPPAQPTLQAEGPADERGPRKGPPYPTVWTGAVALPSQEFLLDFPPGVAYPGMEDGFTQSAVVIMCRRWFDESPVRPQVHHGVIGQ
jgi:hypothetical protein